MSPGTGRMCGWNWENKEKGNMQQAQKFAD